MPVKAISQEGQMVKSNQDTVKVAWDNETKVWVADIDDVPR